MFTHNSSYPNTDTTIREIHRVDSSIIAPISVNRRREELRTLVEKEGTLLVQLGSWDNHLTTKDSVRRAVETSKLSMKNQKQFVSLLDPRTCLSVQGRLVRTFVKARDGSRAAPVSDATVIRSFVPYLALAIHHDLYVLFEDVVLNSNHSITQMLTFQNISDTER